MPSAELERALLAILPIRTVDSLQDFPFKDYREFLASLNEGRVELLPAYDPMAFLAIATPGHRALHYMLALGVPVLMAGGCVLGAVKLANARLWLGMPLVVLAIATANQPFMQSFGKWLNRALFFLLAYFCWEGAFTEAVLLAAYLVTNVTAWAGCLQCRFVFIEAVKESELVLVWLVQKGSLLAIPIPHE